MYLYLNNLRKLPNFGCRTTGNALADLLRESNHIEEYDAIESLNWPGAWGSYARTPLKDGGLVPRSLYSKAWHHRNTVPRLVRAIQFLDSISGGKHDYITTDPVESIELYRQFTATNPELSGFEESIERSEGIVINGEGTLIFGNPTLRDALYLLFVMALAKAHDKPVFILNAMIAECPYNGPDIHVLQQALPLLEYCKVIAVRDMQSFDFLSSLIKTKNVTFIPDALFTWGPRIRACVEAVHAEPRLCIAHPDKSKSDLPLDKPYICISGSSSAWRHDEEIRNQFPKLISSLRSLGYPVFCVETCDGDYFLEEAAQQSGAFFISKFTPVMAAAGLIAGALVYVTGRYHPAIMASAGGIPCVFLASNSHKTRSIQYLLGYEDLLEFPVCPNDQEIGNILDRTRQLIANRTALSEKIIRSFEDQRKRASEFADIITKATSTI